MITPNIIENVMRSDPYEIWAAVYDDFLREVNPGGFNYFNWEVYLLVSGYKKEMGPLLDLGCGTGLGCIWFSKKGYDVAGLDISQKMLDRAIEKTRQDDLRIEYSCQDITELSINKEFCAMYAKETMAHLIDEKSLVKAFTRCFSQLKKNGILIFAMGVKDTVTDAQAHSVAGECPRFKWKIDSAYDAARSIQTTKYILQFSDHKEYVIPIVQKLYDIAFVTEALRLVGFRDVGTMDSEFSFDSANNTAFNFKFSPVTSMTKSVLFGARK